MARRGREEIEGEILSFRKGRSYQRQSDEALSSSSYFSQVGAETE